ncbi:hypothetical protein AAG906_013563 [Vitis piasezkii]
MVVAESLTDYKREDSSKETRSQETTMLLEWDQARRLTFGKEDLLGALQVNPNPSAPKTSLLSGVQVKEEKGEQAKVARTHIEEQHSKHRKRTSLHPSKALREKEVKNILAERVTKRQRVPHVIEYLVQWKGLPKRQVSWEHVDSLRRFWKHIERGKLLETPGAIYTKTLVGRVWKVLKMPRDVHTSLHYGGRHERSLRLSREF